MSANARAAGTYQADALQNIVGEIVTVSSTGVPVGTGAMSGTTGVPTGGLTAGSSGYQTTVRFSASGSARTSTETRGASTAVSPMILV